MNDANEPASYRSPHRFFVDPHSIKRDSGGFFMTLEGEEAHHAINVLRLRPGDHITVLDGEGLEYPSIIGEFTDPGSKSPRMIATASESYLSVGEPPFDVTLIQALPKGEKMDQIVQKATEVGVTRIRPVFSDRVIVRYPGERAKRRLQRWRKIVFEAAKQSGRGRVPEIDAPSDLRFAVEAELAANASIVMFWEASSTPLKQVVSEIQGPIALIVGPEGGFTEREVEGVLALGGREASLGPRILRTETAGPVACALLLYALGDGEVV